MFGIKKVGKYYDKSMKYYQKASKADLKSSKTMWRKQKTCDACGEDIGSGEAHTTHDIRVPMAGHRKISNSPEQSFTNVFNNLKDSTAVTGMIIDSTMKGITKVINKDDGVTARLMRLHDLPDCIIGGHDELAEYVFSHPNFLKVYTAKVIDDIKYAYSTTIVDANTFDIVLFRSDGKPDTATHDMLERLHDSQDLVLAWSSGLQGTQAFTFPILLRKDNRMVQNGSPVDADAFAKAEEMFQARGGNSNVPRVRIRALYRYAVDTIIQF